MIHYCTLHLTPNGYVAIHGCRTSYFCRKCGTTVQCDSGGRAGTWADDVYFIPGPCCCVMASFGPCAACEAIEKAARREDLEECKRGDDRE